MLVCIKKWKCVGLKDGNFEILLRCFVQKKKIWRILKRKRGKVTAGETESWILIHWRTCICFSVGCSRCYEKTPIKYMCSEAMHLKTYFNASNSPPSWTQISQLLCVGVCMWDGLWRVEASGCVQHSHCFAPLTVCRSPGFGCLWARVAGNQGCKTVVCDLMISMVSPGVSVLQSFHTSPAFPVLALLECSTRLWDKTGEMVVK